MSPNIIERICTKSGCYQRNVQQKALPANKQDSNYRAFYSEKRPLLILHSFGCARDSADVQVARWNNQNGQAIAHAAVDAREGYTDQSLPWDFRGWHAGEAGNNVAIGVEMAESLSIRYTRGDRFEILDRNKARANCETAYNGAVELFAYLCQMFGIDPLEKREINGKTFPAVLGHCEWNRIRGVAGHTDPEHYWTQLGMPYTMDTFRQAVKAKLEGSTQEDGPIYRIQVGAFRNKAYAEAYLARVQDAGFPNAYITTTKGGG